MNQDKLPETMPAVSAKGLIAETAETHRSRNSVRGLLASTATLYASFGLIYGLMQGGLQPLMRARGIDLAAIGWSFLMLVPFGLTFLWAPIVDAIRPIRSAPRIGWIVPMQGVIVAALLIVAQGEAFPPALLLALGILVAFSAATMDVALDALSTASVPAAHRTTAGGLKVAALALGSIFGGGVFVAMAGRIGWTATFQICAAVSALATVPILLNRAWDRPSVRSPNQRPDVLVVIRQPDMRKRMMLLTLATCSMVALAFFNRIMLVDLGVPVETIGWIVGTGAPLCGLLASLAAIPLVRRSGSGVGIFVFATFCLLAAAGMFIGVWREETSPALIGAILMNAGTSGFFVILSATTLGWAQGTQPATDYAVLFGASRLVATVLLIGLANVVARIGWPAFYVCASLALVGVTLLLRRALPDLRAASHLPDTSTPAR
jgi:MFS family permease